MDLSTALEAFTTLTTELPMTMYESESSTMESFTDTTLAMSSAASTEMEELQEEELSRLERGCLISDYFHVVIMLGLLVLFGTVGNTLTIIVLWTKRNKNSTSLLLIWLAVFDNGVVIMRFILNGK
jgi:hypothetical protein